ncbi:MAG: hypothetical protein QF489_01485 [Planctomycetota bacterium]|nr:hypothetical protein [Planctomycetota bacterium]
MRILGEQYAVEQHQALAHCLHQAAALLEMRRDGLVAYQPHPSLLGPSLRELQKQVDQLSEREIQLRKLDPLQLCALSRKFGNDSELLMLTEAASYYRSGQVRRGRDRYVMALMKAESRPIRARCLTSLAAIHYFEGDYVAAQKFSGAAMEEKPGLRLAQDNRHKIERIYLRKQV